MQQYNAHTTHQPTHPHTCALFFFSTIRTLLRSDATGVVAALVGGVTVDEGATEGADVEKGQKGRVIE